MINWRNVKNLTALNKLTNEILESVGGDFSQLTRPQREFLAAKDSELSQSELRTKYNIAESPQGFARTVVLRGPLKLQAALVTGLVSSRAAAHMVRTSSSLEIEEYLSSLPDDILVKTHGPKGDAFNIKEYVPKTAASLNNQMRNEYVSVQQENLASMMGTNVDSDMFSRIEADVFNKLVTSSEVINDTISLLVAAENIDDAGIVAKLIDMARMNLAKI